MVGIGIKIELDRIRELCTDVSFARGKIYFEEGRVRIKDASPTRIEATVAGADHYQVEVDLTHGIAATCDCPYSFEGYCKHIVATLLAVRDEPDEVAMMIEQSISQTGIAEAVLEKMQPDALRSFLSDEMERSPEMKARFLAIYGQKGEEKSVSDYKSEIEDLYDELEDRGFIPYGREVDFSSHEELAEIYAKKRDFLEAAKIYQALTEVIARKMDSVDDSDGYYGYGFEGYLDEFLKCLKAADLDEAARRGYIKYFFRMYLKRDPDYFQDDYRKAIKKLCISEEDLRYWESLQEKHLPEIVPEQNQWRSYSEAQELISSQLELLSDLGEKAQLDDLLKKYYRSSEDLLLRYARKLLEDGDRDEALQVAEEGLSLFPRSQRSLRDFLSEIYEGTSPEKYRENLLALFLNSSEWKYYERLKAASSDEEWRNLFAQILEHFSQGPRRTVVIDIYLREKMYDEAIKEVLAVNRLAVLEQYQKQLADQYPKEYFDAYRDLIIPYASSRTGRDHYKDVVRILNRMKTIGGCRGAWQDIVERLRRENTRKPAFIEEMKEL